MRSQSRRLRKVKPNKGQKQFMRTNKIAKFVASIRAKKDQYWHKPAAVRWLWLKRFNRSKYAPHQGELEKARRIAQRLTERFGARVICVDGRFYCGGSHFEVQPETTLDEALELLNIHIANWDKIRAEKLDRALYASDGVTV